MPIQDREPREKDVICLSRSLYVSASQSQRLGSYMDGEGKVSGSVFCKYWPDESRVYDEQVSTFIYIGIHVFHKTYTTRDEG